MSTRAYRATGYRPTEASHTCCGGRWLDQDLVERWLAALFERHPEWSAVRVSQRATVEAMKGKQP